MATALLIDVVDQSVTTIEIDTPSDILVEIGNDCQSTDGYRMPNGDYLCYNMEALYKTPEGGFSIVPMNWLLMGKAVLVGWDENNGSILNCTSTPTEIINALTWYDVAHCEQAQK